MYKVYLFTDKINISWILNITLTEHWNSGTKSVTYYTACPWTIGCVEYRLYRHKSRM